MSFISLSPFLFYDKPHIDVMKGVFGISIKETEWGLPYIIWHCFRNIPNALS